MEMAHIFKNKWGLDVKPGMKLCPTCQIKLNQEPKEESQEETSSDGDDFQSAATEKFERGHLDNSLAEMGLSPIILHSLASNSHLSYGKERLLKQRRHLEHSKRKLNSS